MIKERETNVGATDVQCFTYKKLPVGQKSSNCASVKIGTTSAIPRVVWNPKHTKEI